MNTTKYPLTFRDSCNMAEERGSTAVDLLEMLGPIPTSPAGYALAHGSDFRWTGPEIMNRRWIITPVWTWNSDGGTHSIELWMADHEAPDYAVLTPADAIQLAADLAAVASKIAAAEATEA